MLIKKIKRVINKENIEKLKGIEDHIKEEIKNGTVTDDSLSMLHLIEDSLNLKYGIRPSGLWKDWNFKRKGQNKARKKEEDVYN